jgi:hypothetical protein
MYIPIIMYVILFYIYEIGLLEAGSSALSGDAFLGHINEHLHSLNIQTS